MSIKLELRKKMIKGKKYYTLTGFTLLGVDDLPSEYFDNVPYAYKTQGGILELRMSARVSHRYIPGGDYTRVEIDNLIKYLHYAGERLHLINKTVAMENLDWRGNHEIVI